MVEAGNRPGYLCFQGFYMRYRGEPLINVFLRSILTFFVKARVLIYNQKNRLRSIFLELLQIVEGSDLAGYLCFWTFYRHYKGGPLINVFMRVFLTFLINIHVLIFTRKIRVRSIYFFPFCTQKSLVTELVIYVFLVFISILGETPDKRITEGVFCRLSSKFPFIFLPIEIGFLLHFWSYCT